jgi:hypothetical protein
MTSTFDRINNSGITIAIVVVLEFFNTPFQLKSLLTAIKFTFGLWPSIKSVDTVLKESENEK